jgi:hypothetical protein
MGGMQQWFPEGVFIDDNGVTFCTVHALLPCNIRQEEKDAAFFGSDRRHRW